MSEFASQKRADTEDDLAFLAGGGGMGARMRALDWSRTALGEPSAWPASLKAVVRVVLTSRFAMWMAWGPELTFFCNDAYLPTVGIKRDWVLGARSDRVWAEIWPDIGPRIERVLRSGEATWDEALLLYLERSGFSEETYHTFSYSPLADDSGRTSGMLCVVAEVTERVIGERQLAVLRDLGVRLAAAATRAEVMAALESCLSAEPHDLPFALAYLVGPERSTATLAAAYRLDAAVRLTPHTLDLDDPAAAWPLRQAAHSTVVIELGAEKRAPPELDRSQSAPRLAMVAAIEPAEGGAPVGYLVAGLNPHRAFDDSYRGFVDLLTGQIAAAVARADAYERERSRADALAEIDRAKTLFFSNVSHEFRTPLTLMLGPLGDVLARPPSELDAQLRGAIEVAHRNGLRLMRLVNALLDFSRLEAGRVVASYQPTDVASYTAELVSSFRSATDRAGVGLTVRSEPASIVAHVDRDMWETIVLNLLSNAFKFTFEGEIAVELAAVGDVARLTVRDTGSGIPTHELPFLFERFHRVEGAKGRSIEGSGIGLALVRELARLHGGDVSVESMLDRGSSFVVSIPLGAARAPAGRIAPADAEPIAAARAAPFVQEALRWLPEPPPAGFDEAAATASPRTASGRILIADDNADMRDYLQRLLAVKGYAVEAVGDGQAALDRLRIDRPDLLLTDVMMPRLDGFALLLAVRADPGLRDLPVIVLSARAGEEAEIEGLDAGADDYLVKPFSARELLARVDATLRMARLRHESATAIRLRTAQFETLLNEAPLGVYLVDADFRIREVNPTARRAFGDIADLVGRDFGEVICVLWPKDYADEVVKLFRRTLETGEPYNAPERVEDRLDRGETEYYEWRINRIALPDGRFGVVCYFRDISAQVLARQKIVSSEEAVRDLNATLEQRVALEVAERARAEEALHQAQKMEAIGQLTGGVAHDFNNLLTVIRSSADLLRLGTASEERKRRYIDAIADTADRAATLTRQLLAFSRRQALQAEVFDAAARVDGVAEMLQTVLGSRIALDVRRSGQDCFVEADATQFETALVNMAVNARDAMSAEGRMTISIDVEGARSDADQPPVLGYVAVTVADIGVGIAPGDLARIFEPFFTTKSVGKGTGLGLSQVYGFAKQSGGTIRVESELGAGAAFTLTLPRAAAPTASERPSTSDDIRIGSGRVLVVEDNPAVGEFAAQMLGDLGYEAVLAANGQEALDALEVAFPAFDVVFTDVVMPGIDGVELARRVQAGWPGMRVVLTSGYSDVLASDARHGLPLLHKPYSIEDLSRMLAQ